MNRAKFKKQMADVARENGRDFLVSIYNDSDDIVITSWHRTPIDKKKAEHLRDGVIHGLQWLASQRKEL